MAAVYFGNRGSSLRLDKGAMERIGIRVEGAVLRGQVSVREGQQLASKDLGQRGLSFLAERERLLDRASGS